MWNFSCSHLTLSSLITSTSLTQYTCRRTTFPYLDCARSTSQQAGKSKSVITSGAHLTRDQRSHFVKPHNTTLPQIHPGWASGTTASAHAADLVPAPLRDTVSPQSGQAANTATTITTPGTPTPDPPQTAVPPPSSSPSQATRKLLAPPPAQAQATLPHEDHHATNRVGQAPTHNPVAGSVSVPRNQTTTTVMVAPAAHDPEAVSLQR